jgi:hypothetical protein
MYNQIKLQMLLLEIVQIKIRLKKFHKKLKRIWTGKALDARKTAHKVQQVPCKIKILKLV